MKHQQGFTVVELLITLVVGSLLLFSAYQLYTYVLNDSTEARMRAVASSLAYQTMREQSSLATTPCTAPSVSPPAVPSTLGLPSNTALSVVFSCPGPTSDLTRITATVTYGSNPQKVITHATYIRK